MFSNSKKARATDPDAAPAARDITRLPQGAEAALWSIVESMPDPRNHLALTRDPTAEVRVSRRQLDEAMAAPPPRASQLPATGVVIEPPAEAGAAADAAPLPRREGIRWSADTAEVRLPATRYARGA
jgi:hypothetical protein